MAIDLQIRPVTAADIDLVCRHRLQMFLASGRAASDLSPMMDAFRLWLAPKLADGGYFGYFAEVEGRAVGGVGLMILDWPPHPLHPVQDRRGYVLNLYVEEAHRGRDVARTLIARSERAFQERGVDYAILHPTAMGRPLYEREAWAATGEMGKRLKPD